jgi:ubiquinone/menaquinone biosynthesis C-methylase UbiE
MIGLARAAVRAAGLDDRVRLLQASIPGAPFPDHSFDAILSKDLLHHLPDAAALWREVVRLGRPGATVHVMDLLRPDTPETARRIVDEVAAGEDPILQDDFYNSLCAAFTIDEVREQVATARLPLTVERIGDRHMLVAGRI